MKQTQFVRTLRGAVIWATLVGSLAVTACASLIPKPPEEQVRQRIQERWQALSARDFNRAYTYTTPGYKGVVSVDAYRARFGTSVMWIGGEAASVNCAEATKCTARVKIEYSALVAGRAPDKLSTYIDETWLLEEGQWWVFQPIQSN